MAEQQKFAFIGAGNMAGALIRGLLGTGSVTAEQITAADPDSDRLSALQAELGIGVTSDNAEAVSGADVVVLATKPQVFAQVLPGLASTLPAGAVVISIAAGIPTAQIEQALPGGARVVRTMPNTPALVGAGATAIAAGQNAEEDDVALAEGLFRGVGVAVRVPEASIDAVTGLSGSGPAYVFAVIEALRDAGIREGLPEDTALLLASQTVFGAAKLLLEQNEPPEVLRERVTSPGGTTRAGLDALARAGFDDAIAGAVRAATRRSVELGKITDS